MRYPFLSSQKIEDFVQSSGENGVVVFSLMSMVSNLTEERANVIASALAQIPQRLEKVPAWWTLA
jgi:glucuronosyltransferase